MTNVTSQFSLEKNYLFLDLADITTSSQQQQQQQQRMKRTHNASAIAVA
jgi:hypothetical protein